MITYGLAKVTTLEIGFLATTGETHQVIMRNGSFESDLLLEGWDVITYCTKAVLARDDRELHEGRRSLPLTASEASDTALAQEISLKPSCWYRFTGWVKTLGLEPVDASVTGTF
jgi:hypothetical protein